jgi:general stress protein 26
MPDKNSVLQYLKSKNLCVLSTVSVDGKSESAVMAYMIKDDFTILMNTESSTRKVQNILENNQVSIVVGGINGDPSVQIDATARIADNQQSKDAKEFLLSQNPELANYFTDTGRFIVITPTWLRWSDYSQNPAEIKEIFIIENANLSPTNNFGN